jgi:cytochrome P450
MAGSSKVRYEDVSGSRVHFDPMDLATALDPYPAYDALRELAPVYHNKEHDFWAIARYDDVRAASQDWQTFSSAQGVEIDDADELFGIGGGDFLASDPPRHDVLRQVVRGSFAPKAVAELGEMVRGRVRELVAGLLSADSPDFARGLAQPLPVHVICRFVGLPEADDSIIKGFFDDVFLRAPGQRTVPKRAHAAARAVRAYLEEDKRVEDAARRSSFARDLLDAEQAGTISRSEAVDLMVLLLAAAIKTTSGLIGHMLLRLAESPEQRELLRSDRSLIPAAVEETLRFDAPAQWLTRVTTTDAEVADVAIPERARVLLLYGSANRDDRKFENPDVFDICRPPQRHLGLGNGIHFCLGAPIARLEAGITLEVLFDQQLHFELAGKVERVYAPAERELAALPVAFTG